MKITLGTTYYNNPDQIINFVNHHINYVDELIVVDDGSPDFPLTNYIYPNDKIKIFVVSKDYGFNSHGCRNLIMSKASNDWVVLMDSDRLMIDPQLSIYNIKKTKLSQQARYRFIVHVMELGNDVHLSVNDYLINKSHFFSAGGYDEEIIGVRDGDRQFFKQLLHFGIEKEMHGVEIIFTRRPSSGENNQSILSDFDRNMTPDQKMLIEKRIVTPDPNKPILTFAWEQIT